MRHRFPVQSEARGHASRNPFSTRSLPMRRRYFVLSLLVCCVPSPAFAQRYSFTSFSVPGATFRRAFDINNTGTIVGDFVDAGGANHGFVYSGVYPKNDTMRLEHAV